MRQKTFLLAALMILALAVVWQTSRPVGVEQAVAQTGSGATDGGIAVTVAVSKPANGSFLAAGERAVVTVTLKDKFGVALNKDDFATLNLYMYGPQETAKTVTASKLLNAVTDRSKTPHHYINLLTDPNVQLECCATGQTRPSGLEGNVLKYSLQAVTDEEPGTYRASLWAIKKGDPPVNQAFSFADFQLGTSVVEKQIVEKEKCAACHLGASSGQFYFAHVDPGRNPYGSPSIDSVPVITCKSCHNNDGYSAYRGNVNDPNADPNTVRTPDPIVRRVHGVHMGEELANPFNNDPKTGDFRDYTSVVFPANVKNCTACHVDDRWKTMPSRQACGACHDSVWFGEAASIPKAFKAHPGGPQPTDANCASCHPADSGGLMPVAQAHKVSLAINAVDVSLTPPANGKFYTTGDKPIVTLVFKDDAGNPIDHTSVDLASFSNAGLFVYGPRAQTKPVLTSAAKNGISKARASISNSIAANATTKGWTFGANDTFKIAVNTQAPVELTAPAGVQTPAQVRDWLASKLSGVTVSATATNVTIRSNLQGEKSRIDIYNSPVTTIMGWKQAGLPIARGGATAGVTMEPYVNIGQSSYMINDLRKLSDPLDFSDPAVTRNAANITYQLDEVKDLAAGTYRVLVRYSPVAGKSATLKNAGFGSMTFQVGTATEELKIATNCTQCHGDTRMHGTVPFDPDYCKACHDYARHSTGESYARLGGTSLSGWSGFGAPPIARRVHGVHRGLYLDHPEEIYGGNPNVFAEVIFPQDIRNCTKCHDPKTTSAAWKENPSRLACNACHDSDIAKSHTKLQTELVQPSDVWNPANVETCKVCHGAGRDFAVDKVHNISDPYQPPYPREP